MDTKQEVSSSSYFTDSVSTLQHIQEKHIHLKEINTIVCLGLGHFAWCASARNQLAFITLIQEELAIPEILFQDPAFTPGEIDILKTLGFDVIPGNLEGKFDTDPEKIYLFYLPHCPKQLTNNLLWQNWGTKLSNIILLSNSFSGILISQSQRSLQVDAKLIVQAEDFTEEIPLENNFIFTDVFNDTSIHIFPKDLVEKKSENFWDERGSEPIYCDPEFISSALEKVTLEDDSCSNTEIPTK
uniref:SRR1-like domain-containing protein n=1 Tax=Phlebotomus papatasi TaxID=29031 RepID=A0A1B0DFG6_PHLPP